MELLVLSTPLAFLVYVCSFILFSSPSLSPSSNKYYTFAMCS